MASWKRIPRNQEELILPSLILHGKRKLNLVDDVEDENFNLDNEGLKKMKLSDGNNVEIGFLN